MMRKNNRSQRRGRPMSRAMAFRPKTPCPLKSSGVTDVDYKDISMLTHYVGEEWKILPAWNNHISAPMQRKIKTAIKRARYLSLLPYTPHHSLISRSNSSGRES